MEKSVGGSVEDEMVRFIGDIVRGVMRRYRAGEIGEAEASVVLYRCGQFLKVMGDRVGVRSGRCLGLGGMREEVGEL